jgi:RNA-directed DNA polymerase
LLRPAPRASPLRCAPWLPCGRLLAPLTVRYADDIAIFASSQRSAERIHERIVEWIEKHLKLEVNREKSGVGPSGGSSPLGFRIDEEGRIGVSLKVMNPSPWIRRHMRKCFWIRWKTPRGRINALKRLGVRGRALGLGYTGRGAWATARTPALQQALRNNTPARYGFIIPGEVAAKPGTAR